MKPRLIFSCLIFLAGCSSPPVTLSFPEFPEGIVVVDLGQSVTIEVKAENDGGRGVTWSCAGAACVPLKSTPTAMTFKAIGITGNAKITATSIKQPAISRTINIVVGLNESPDLLCKNKEPGRAS